jgi:hypothetical protein
MVDSTQDVGGLARAAAPLAARCSMSRVAPVSGPDLQDVGLYLRGLVQLMAADRNLDAAQKRRIHAYAAEQGFDARFIENAMDSVLDNEHFPQTPPRFHSPDTALRFLRDAVLLALCDGVLHPREQQWLLAAARQNGIDPSVVTEALSGAGGDPANP